MTKKRTRLEIIKDILEVIKNKNGKIKPTHILYKSNLSHEMMSDYLAELQAKGFIKQEHQEDHITYSITGKGLEYLDRYKLIADFTGSFGLS